MTVKTLVEEIKANYLVTAGRWLLLHPSLYNKPGKNAAALVSVQPDVKRVGSAAKGETTSGIYFFRAGFKNFTFLERNKFSRNYPVDKQINVIYSYIFQSYPSKAW